MPRVGRLPRGRCCCSNGSALGSDRSARVHTRDRRKHVIIDVHSHMGYDEIFEHDFPAEDLLWAQERNGVDITIVQPGSCVLLETVRRQHDAIAAFAAQYPGRFFWMA